ncbi:putative s-adenosyl-L-methionine-dependent methyltransferase [Haemophilus haemolyticus M21639]|nr:putative s-adenosyl-L-methionine-dependent methyltransferase [Haemophilus haemolyticus M21639]
MANQNTFKQAPLPFIGQKRMFLKQFEQILNENIPDDGEGWTILDTFGGSGLLSHTVKRLKPKARVIYNDFDGYAERLAHIDDINQLRAELYSVVGNATSKNKRMTKD